MGGSPSKPTVQGESSRQSFAQHYSSSYPIHQPTYPPTYPPTYQPAYKPASPAIPQPTSPAIPQLQRQPTVTTTSRTTDTTVAGVSASSAQTSVSVKSNSVTDYYANTTHVSRSVALPVKVSRPIPSSPVTAKLKIDALRPAAQENVVAVDGDISIELCGRHFSNQGCNEDRCRRLHVCRFFFLSHCSEDCCIFGHSLRTKHNSSALAFGGVSHLTDGEIIALLKEHRSKYTTPSPCKNYNQPGGTCRKRDGCLFLHICAGYFEGNCALKGKCHLSHQIIDQHNKFILVKFGINVDRPAMETLAEIRLIMATPADKRSPQSAVRSPRDAESSQPVLGQRRLDRSVCKICTFHLDGNCRYGQSCSAAHFDKPYLWQIASMTGSSQFLIHVNDQLEKLFCDARNDEVDITLPLVSGKLKLGQSLQGKEFTFIASTSTALSSTDPMSNPAKFIRWSTPSRVERSGAASKSTDWVWYWQDENNEWIEYGALNTLQMKSDMTSTHIEMSFLANPQGNVTFNTNHGQSYALDFVKMTQTNVKYRTERRVRRRPRVADSSQSSVSSSAPTASERATQLSLLVHSTVSAAAYREYIRPRDRVVERQQLSTGTTGSLQRGLPKNWLSMTTEEMIRVPLVPGAEYNKVQWLFKKTMPQATIVKIERIQNPHLWRQFMTEKKRLQVLLGEEELNNRLLFHGMKEETVKQICHQNFDWRLVGTNVGFVWGKGSYFARDASFSHDYATPNRHGRRFMFVADVVVGRSTLGRNDYLRPPAVDPAVPEKLFDSCVNSMLDPTIFVIFKDQQCYPAFLVEYLPLQLTSIDY